MVCDVCSSIDFNPEHNRRPKPTQPTSPLPKPETRHHASIEDLQCAAERGCQLCRLIAKQLDTYPEFRVRNRAPTFTSKNPTPEQKQMFVRFDRNSPFAPRSQYPVQDMVVFSDGLGMELVLGLFVPSGKAMHFDDASDQTLILVQILLSPDVMRSWDDQLKIDQTLKVASISFRGGYKSVAKTTRSPAPLLGRLLCLPGS